MSILRQENQNIKPRTVEAVNLANRVQPAVGLRYQQPLMLWKHSNQFEKPEYAENRLRTRVGYEWWRHWDSRRKAPHRLRASKTECSRMIKFYICKLQKLQLYTKSTETCMDIKKTGPQYQRPLDPIRPSLLSSSCPPSLRTHPASHPLPSLSFQHVPPYSTHILSPQQQHPLTHCLLPVACSQELPQ